MGEGQFLVGGNRGKVLRTGNEASTRGPNSRLGGRHCVGDLRGGRNALEGLPYFVPYFVSYFVVAGTGVIGLTFVLGFLVVDTQS
jgi:hypothetical protein